MSWIEKLHQTYENNTNEIGSRSDTVPLLPICHTTQNAHITVVINSEGNFLRAAVVPKAEARTIIPATEKSAGRTSGTTPHPLCDKLQYVAAEYSLFGGEKKACFEMYYELLTKWSNADSLQWKLKAVKTYIAKKKVISDLVEASVLHLDQNTSKLLLEWPDKKNKPEIFNQMAGESWQADAFIRWSVEAPGILQSEVWSDKNLWTSWENYYCGLESRRGLCYVSGIETDLAAQHPAKIRNDGDKAKLISSGKTTGKDGKDKVDDSCGFTFLGRFTASDEACGVGYQSTQKAHSALRWLIARQGRRDGDQAVVAWAVSGVQVPDPLADTFSLLYDGEEKIESTVGYTAQHVGVQLAKLIGGYAAKLGNTDEVVVMALDSATPGRMAIRYYRELTGSEFLERVQSWHTGCCWKQYFGKDRIFIGAPAPRDIAETAYGRRLDDKLRKATVERLLPCIIDGAVLPRDLVESCVRRASNPSGIEHWEWEKALGIACALYKYHHKEGSYSMALERERNSRDYLFGRLLALAEHLESRALYVGGEKRATNAEKLMQRFADRPQSTWLILETSLAPHKVRLSAKRPGFLHNIKQEIDTVVSAFATEDFVSDKRLSGEFLLGYHCQRAALRSEPGHDLTETEEESAD